MSATELATCINSEAYSHQPHCSKGVVMPIIWIGKKKNLKCGGELHLCRATRLR